MHRPFTPEFPTANDKQARLLPRSGVSHVAEAMWEGRKAPVSVDAQASKCGRSQSQRRRSTATSFRSPAAERPATVRGLRGRERESRNPVSIFLNQSITADAVDPHNRCPDSAVAASLPAGRLPIPLSTLFLFGVCVCVCVFSLIELQAEA